MSLSLCIVFITHMLWPEAHTWLKEYLEPVSVFVGLPLILPCNPPVGPPKPQTYWMNSCEHQLNLLQNNTAKLIYIALQKLRRIKNRYLKVHSTSFSCSFPAAMVPIRQDRRVSMAENGDLYFSSIISDDALTNYVCTARFPNSNIIHQKPPLILQVHTGVKTTTTMCLHWNLLKFVPLNDWAFHIAKTSWLIEWESSWKNFQSL